MTSEVTVKIDEKNNTVTITLPLADLSPSKSGKTLRVASSEGNVQTDTKYHGKPVIVGCNAYIRNS